MNKTIISLIAIMTVIAAIFTAIAIFTPKQRVENEKSGVQIAEEEILDECTDEYEQMENRSLLLQCIAELGEPDSHIFMMKYYFGYSTKMIAEKFQLKENTVDKKVQRGLQKLKKALEGGAYYES